MQKNETKHPAEAAKLPETTFLKNFLAVGAEVYFLIVPQEPMESLNLL
jgi:hypothetical protein